MVFMHWEPCFTFVIIFHDHSDTFMLTSSLLCPLECEKSCMVRANQPHLRETGQAQHASL